ncbi:MAG: potassium channel protein [Thaumarchaeota archaeon]|nr:potassium channel protein [Nitrososphaerota archaeon]
MKRIKYSTESTLARIAITLVLLIIYGTFSEYYLEHDVQGSGIKSLFDSLWFVVQTITTVGYGDTPVITLAGRINAIAFMLVGIGTLGFFTTKMTSSFIQHSMGKRAGEILLRNKGHIVLCNWNSLAGEIVNALLKENVDLILLAPLEKNPIENIKFFNGTCLNLYDLESVSVKDADLVIIMAEKLWNEELASAIDAKTILGIMNARRINPNVRIMAEMLKSDSADNARLAGANEVVVQGDMAAKLLAHAALYPGTVDMMKILLSSNSGQQIFEDPIPPAMKGKRYGDLRTYVIERNCIAMALKRSNNILVNPTKDEILGDDVIVYLGKTRIKF